MGQQQLLLVILVTIIVGIATVVAINTFGSASESANLDAVRQDLGAMGVAAQAFYEKPEILGGGGRSFSGITMEELAFAGVIIENDLGVNDNGTYEIQTDGDADFTITAYAASAEDYDRNNGTATLEATVTGRDIDINEATEGE